MNTLNSNRLQVPKARDRKTGPEATTAITQMRSKNLSYGGRDGYKRCT